MLLPDVVTVFPAQRINTQHPIKCAWDSARSWEQARKETVQANHEPGIGYCGRVPSSFVTSCTPLLNTAST
jgi:hypothetical protein